MAGHGQSYYRIVELLREGKTPKEIEFATGKPVAYVYNVARAEQIEYKRSKPGRKSTEEKALQAEKKDLSPLHRQIGRDVFHYQVVLKDISNMEMAETFGVSLPALLDIQSGLRELSLSELQRISDVICGADPHLPANLQELVTLRSNKLRAA